MSFNIWNNLDEIALYLGLERLDSETNESFYNRIRKFGRWKYKTDYYTQVHSIPLQGAMETKNLVKINCSGNYECKLDWEYFTLSNTEESIRVFIGGFDNKLSKILDAISESTTFTYSLYDESLRETPCQTLIRNSNVKRNEEFITSNKSRLNKNNIFPGSIIAKSGLSFKNEKTSLDSLVLDGDYFVEYNLGYLEFLQKNFDNGFIGYSYYDKSFFIEYTELNLIPVNLIAKYGITDKLIELIPYLLNKRVWGK